ncbi:unnamed protein product [Orchesella dallaii]|uniref:HTH CENPB-type domain-containing protein n=1 Tax=Orchesella dallaii TaxID=48710 RepID=A0ABP1S403_9HEXA
MDHNSIHNACSTNKHSPFHYPHKSLSAERYAPQFKEKVLKYLEQGDEEDTPTEKPPSSKTPHKYGSQTIASAAAKFHVHPTTISDWVQNKRRQAELKNLQEISMSIDTQSQQSSSTPTSSASSIAKKSKTNAPMNKVESEIISILNKERVKVPLSKETNVQILKQNISQQIQAIVNDNETSFTPSTTPSKMPWYVIWWKRFDTPNSSESETFTTQTAVPTEEAIDNSMSVPTEKKSKSTTLKRISYPPSFKEEICKYAESLGQRSASRLFGISQKRIFDWISDAKCQPESSVRKRAAVLRTRRRNLSKIRKSLVYYTGSIEMNNFPQPKPTTKEIDAKVEAEIHEWIRSQEPRQVPSTEVRQKAKDIYRKYGRVEIECSYGWYRRFKARLNSNGKLPEGRHEEDDQIVLTWLLQVYDNNDLVSYKDLQCFAQKALQEIKPEFKASAGWAMRFLKRNHAVINWDGIYSNPLPPSLENQVTTCRGQLKSFFEQYSMNAIGCMDEIPLSFTNSTLVKKGSVYQPVSRLRKNSIKNCDATVILSLLADSTLLPPMLIVKGRLNSSMDQVYNTPYSPIVTYYSNSTEPSSTSLEKWLDLIWSKNVSSPSCLIADSYTVHQHLIEKCNFYNTECVLIPNGCSLRLQPLNVFGKQIFMENMEKLWLRYLKPAGDDCGEKIRLPTTNEVVAWVQQSFEVTKFQKDKLEQSFQRVIEG